MFETTDDKGKLLATEIGAGNERSFLSILAPILDDCVRDQAQLWVCLLCEDDQPFYYPSEQFSQSVLTEMALLLREKAGLKGVVNTWGYEKLSIILTGIDLEQALEKAQLFSKIIAEGTFKRGEEPLRMTVSIGLAGYPLHGFRCGEIFQAAIEAFHGAQENGGNCVKVAAGKDATGKEND